MGNMDTPTQIALGALADIAFYDDMTLDLARKKAKRIYEQLTAGEESASGAKPQSDNPEK